MKLMTLGLALALLYPAVNAVGTAARQEQIIM